MVKNGKGKEYDYDGKLEFEGEYLNGKKWNGKIFDYRKDEEYIINNGSGKVKEYYDIHLHHHLSMEQFFHKDLQT